MTAVSENVSNDIECKHESEDENVCVCVCVCVRERERERERERHTHTQAGRQAALSQAAINFIPFRYFIFQSYRYQVVFIQCCNELTGNIIFSGIWVLKGIICNF
jgi:hypothetical protein